MYEEALTKRPDLQLPERRKGALGEPPPPNRPHGKDERPPSGQPGSVPLHPAACLILLSQMAGLEPYELDEEEDE